MNTSAQPDDTRLDFRKQEKRLRSTRGVLIGVGIVSVLMAGVGLWYNFVSLSADFSTFLTERDIPYFYPAYYTMSAICIVCYIVLLICGIQFIRLRTGVVPLFVGVIIFEIAYFFSIGPMWLIPKIGMSIGAATGVANGGLSFQGIILFPLWAPVLALWASSKLKKTKGTGHITESAAIGP